MADITRAPLLRHLRGTPTTYIRHQKGDHVVHEGTARSFWFRPLTAAISEVPVDEREVPLLFHARTADFQDVAVGATLTYRIADPATAATRVDFGIDPETGAWTATPLEQVASLLTELAQQHALDLLARLPMRAAVVEGPPAVRERIATGLAGETRLTQTGVEIVAVRVTAVRPEPEMERALQTPAREEVQQDADRATFERRAVAVERERAIAENELQNQIELARREEQLVTRRGQNERRRATEAAAAAKVEAEGRVERQQLEAEAQATAERVAAAARADAVRLVGAAEAETEAAKIAAYAELEAATLLGLAVRELAFHLPQIGTLNLTPDLLTPLFGQLLAGNGTTATEAQP